MRLVPALLFVCSAFACAKAQPFSHSQESAGALARAVAVAIEARDIDALNRLALNENEFREYVWPELPASRPERNLPFSYVWGDLHQKSRAALGQTLARHGGRRFNVAQVRFAGETTDYDGYKVRRQTQISVRGADGSERVVRFFGSIIERGGRFKVFSYVTD